MIFKSNWEKTQHSHQLPNRTVIAMIQDAFPNTTITQLCLIAGGCANLNYCFSLNNSDASLILRIYTRDTKSAVKEKIIGERLKNILPCPKILHLGSMHDYTFSISPCLTGKTLQTHLLDTKKKPNYHIMKDLGELLGKMSDIHFDHPGFFDHALIPIKKSQPSLSDFCLTALHHSNTQLALSHHESNVIESFLTMHRNILDENNEASLVHGDFDPANILVDESDGHVFVSGILDWEFAFSGSPLWDLANMLRYRSELDRSYQDHFIEGLISSGYHLPNNWEQRMDLFNLASLLDCLMCYDPRTRPIRMRDIQLLIAQIVSLT